MPAWIAAAGSVLSAFGAAKSAKSTSKMSLRQSREQIIGDRENSQFNKEQDWYYRQLGRQESQRGLDEFRKFSTVHNYAPNYTNTNPGVVVPTKPVYNQGAYAPPPEPVKKKSGGGIGIGDLFSPLGLAGKLLGL